MKTLYDYATNAACPDRPTWRISPVGYKWAQAVFEDRTQRRARTTKKEEAVAPKPNTIWGEILSNA